MWLNGPILDTKAPAPRPVLPKPFLREAAREAAWVDSTLLVMVTEAVSVTGDVRELELVRPDGRPLPRFTAGAHIDVHVSRDLVRPYFLCSDPGETHRYRIAVLRQEHSRGGSLAMHSLREGQVLMISPPRNNFPLEDSAPHHLLLAGGIGITPIICMAQALASAGRSFDLHYCATSLDRAVFLDLVCRRDRRYHGHVHFDDGDEEQRLNLEQALADAPPLTHLYTCGPRGFMDRVLRSARVAEWDEERLHLQHFAMPDFAMTHRSIQTKDLPT